MAHGLWWVCVFIINFSVPRRLRVINLVISKNPPRLSVGARLAFGGLLCLVQFDNIQRGSKLSPALAGSTIRPRFSCKALNLSNRDLAAIL